MKLARDYSEEEVEGMRLGMAESLNDLSREQVVAMYQVMQSEAAKAASRVIYRTPEKEKRFVCCRCRAKENPDNSAVTWMCEGCGGRVCHNCTLRNKRDPRTYFGITLCSEECFHVVQAESAVLHGHTQEELE